MFSKSKNILCLFFLVLIFFPSCRPKSASSEAPKSLMGLTEAQKQEEIEGRCSRFFYTARAEALKKQISYDHEEFDFFIKAYLEDSSCTETTVYENHLKAAGLTRTDGINGGEGFGPGGFAAYTPTSAGTVAGAGGVGPFVVAPYFTNNPSDPNYYLYGNPGFPIVVAPYYTNDPSDPNYYLYGNPGFPSTFSNDPNDPNYFLYGSPGFSAIFSDDPNSPNYYPYGDNGYAEYYTNDPNDSNYFLLGGPGYSLNGVNGSTGSLSDLSGGSTGGVAGSGGAGGLASSSVVSGMSISTWSGSSSAVIYYFDADDDGFGSKDPNHIYPYVPTSLFSLNNEDCDDQNPKRNPGLGEDCSDGIDNDCDEEVDETKYFSDNDKDGAGDSKETSPKVWEICLYSPSSQVNYLAEYKSSLNNEDCDDTNPELQKEKSWFPDNDNDGFGYGGLLLSKGESVVSVLKCSQGTAGKLDIGGNNYVSNPNDCFDEVATNIKNSELGKDPDCDGFFSGSTEGEDCDPAVFSTWSQSKDRDCDLREDFNSSGQQTDFCIKQNGYGLHSSSSSIVSYSTYTSDSFKGKRELHQCGHDYDMDGCWNYDWNNCKNGYSNVSSSSSEDCEDGTKLSDVNGSSTGIYSRVGSSKYLYTHNLQEFGSDGKACDLLEFKSPNVSGKTSFITRVQVKEKDGSWKDMCIQKEHGTDEALQDFFYHTIWLDDKNKDYDCQSYGKYSYFFEVYSAARRSGPWQLGDDLNFKTTKNLSLGGSYASWNYHISYIRPDGSWSMIASPNQTSESIEKGQSISGRSKVEIDSGEFLKDKSKAIYPIVSKSFKLKHREKDSHRYWGRDNFNIVYTDVSDDYVDIRLVKALCLDNPPDPDSNNAAGDLLSSFEDGSLILSQSHCHHKGNESR